MSRRAVLAAVVAVLFVCGQAGAAPAEQASLRVASFSDAAGDSGAAPDITVVDIGNDVVAGPIVFWVTLANRPDGLAGEDYVAILLDTDRNPATGDQTGSEYFLIAAADGAGLARWDGTTYVEAAAASVGVDFSKSEKALRIEIHPSELGGISSFNLFLVGVTGEDGDVAPNGPPGWSYTFATGKPPLTVLRGVMAPKAPVAGKPLTASILVGRGDTLDLLGEGKVTCSLTVGGKALRAARATLVQGLPVCRWNLPKTAKGKLLKATVSVSFGGSTAKKTFTARVK